MSQTHLVQSALRLVADLGVREICVAAGARNAPVVAALLASRGVRLWNFFEERSAAFFALGRILDTGKPVAVLTTSGTAAAELLPAVIESYYQALPLVALTADRPKSYRGSGAPQSIEQKDLFGPYTPTRWDLDLHTTLPQSATARLDAPIHLNLCLDEPLAVTLPGIDFEASTPLPETGPPTPTPPLDLRTFLASPRPIVLIAGLSARESREVTPLLLSLPVPILAELTSNLWSTQALSPRLLPSSDAVLRALQPTHVLRLGSVPTLRWWRDLEDQADLQVINVSRARFSGLARTHGVSVHPWSSLLSARTLAPAPDAPSLPDTPLPATPPFARSEPALLRTLLQSLPPDSSVFLGNSLPIRECNDLACSLPTGVTFHANRGANGIDGLISTWLGRDADSAPSDSWLILGDLSALYDLAGPWVLPQLGARRRFLVIVNNGGGRIFSRVPGLRTLPPAGRALIENRHRLSFQPLAALWGLTHERIETGEALQTALARFSDPGTYLLELCPDPGQTEAWWAASP